MKAIILRWSLLAFSDLMSIVRRERAVGIVGIEWTFGHTVGKSFTTRRVAVGISCPITAFWNHVCRRASCIFAMTGAQCSVSSASGEIIPFLAWPRRLAKSCMTPSFEPHSWTTKAGEFGEDDDHAIILRWTP